MKQSPIGVLAVVLAGVMLALSGCATRQERNLKTRTVSLAEFAPARAAADQPDGDERAEASVAEGDPRPAALDVEQSLIAADDATGKLETPGELQAEAAARKREREVDADIDRALTLQKPGDRVTINSLVGQINGRPIFADEFFDEIEDAILAARAEVMRQRITAPEFVAAMERTIDGRLRRLVDNELFIADAFASLSPEEKTGLFAFMKTIQEQEIAQKGAGTRGGLEDVLKEEGLTFDELMENRQNDMLIQKLLYDRVQPRVIVSWRDVEREYERRKDEFNPPATITLGMIRLTTAEQTELIEQVKVRFANNASFTEVAEFLKLPDKGVWQKLESPSGKAEDVVIRDEIKAQLKGMAEGQTSAGFELGMATYWISVIEIDQPPGQSLYDVQRELTRELEGRRFGAEAERYASMLRERWVADDINAMRRRLMAIANERYLR